MKIYNQPIELIIDVPVIQANAVIAHPGASTALKTYLMATHAAR